MAALRTEFELRFVFDITRPLRDGEREMAMNALELVEDWRALKGQTANPDVDRIRRFLTGGETPPAALPSKREIDTAVIVAALLRHNGNRTHAAKELGITVRTLRNHITRYGIAIDARLCLHGADGQPLQLALPPGAP